MNPSGTPGGNNGDKQSQYQRKLARQRQLDLMEAAASGTAPTMELDTSAFAETDGSFLRSRNNGSSPSSISGERPLLNPQEQQTPSSRGNHGASIFDHRRDQDDIGSSVNLMDHDTGIYKESRSTSIFDSVRASMSSLFSSGDSLGRTDTMNLHQHHHHDASPAEPDYIGDDSIYSSTSSSRQSSVKCGKTVAPVLASCRAVCANKRLRPRLLMAVAGMLVILLALLLAFSRDGPGTTYRHHVHEKVLRQQNDVRFNEILDHIVMHSVSHTSVFLDLTSPEYHALRWVSYSDPAQLDPADPILLQRYALAVFFYSSYLTFETIAGKQAPIVIGNKQWEGVPNPGWVRKDFWLTERGHCQWYGVTCEDRDEFTPDGQPLVLNHYDSNSPVVGLNLTRNHVVGTMPPEFKALENLKTIDLSHNKVHGNFPWQVARMFQLEKIWMHHNRMTGQLPDQIGFLEGAIEIKLGHNQLTGTIPSEINRLYKLRSLALDNNQLTGNIPQLYNMVKLSHLYLDHNLLNGHFPYSVVRAPMLFELVINDNQISGTIPPEMETVRHLRKFHAENNKIEGPIPDGMFERLHHLQELTLQNNRLSGPLPKDMGSEAILRVVKLNNNKLTGSIPAEWDQMVSVESLHLQENQITGSIPTVVGTMTSLQELWLNNNKLNGILPTQLGQALALKTIYVENNSLQGRVPTEIGLLEDLKTLRMFENEIRGYMPDDVCDLASFHKLTTLAADCAKRGNIMKCDCCTKCY